MPPLLPASEEPDSAASDVGAGVVEPDVVCVDWVLLAASDVVLDVGVDVFEVEVLVTEEDVEEEAVGGSSAVILK
jgi:hypothetical protein